MSRDSMALAALKGLFDSDLLPNKGGYSHGFGDKTKYIHKGEK